MDQKMILHLLLILMTLIEVWGHGRLIEPPSRSSMWRFGFNTEPNYNDNELFCGGFTVQWKQNEGKCGICGDPWHVSPPRDNEAGGKYGKGVIVRNYTSGQVINVTAQITANHKGYFEFKLCPTNDPRKTVEQECFDQYPLEIVEASAYRYVLPDHRPRNFTVHLKLPDGLQCTHCILQWTYTSGNTWGECPGGGSATGCGPQETFRGCADVRISGIGIHTDINNEISDENNESEPLKNQTEHNEVKTDNDKSQSKIIRLIVPSSSDVLIVEKPRHDSTNEEIHSDDSNNISTLDETDKVDSNTEVVTPATHSCKGTGLWKFVQGIDNWCVNNCAMGYCPNTHCRCT